MRRTETTAHHLAATARHLACCLIGSVFISVFALAGCSGAPAAAEASAAVNKTKPTEATPPADAAEQLRAAAALNTQELRRAQAQVDAGQAPVASAQATSLLPVYRFYNTSTGAYFYTMSQ